MPLLRAVEQPKWCGADLGEAAAADAAAHQAGEQVARPAPVPERRRGRAVDACVVVTACRAFTACHSSSSTIRSSGTSTTTRSPASFSRDTRLPVLGSLT